MATAAVRASAKKASHMKSLEEKVQADPYLRQMLDDLVDWSECDRPLHYRRMLTTALGYAYFLGTEAKS